MHYVHVADLHIGRSRRLPGYLERQDAMLAGIFKAAADRSDGLVLIAGDIYDRLDISPRERDLFLRHLSQADRAGITTVLINGNHDMIDEDDGGYTHLRMIKLLVQEKRLQNTIVIETDPTSFWLDKFDIGIIAVPAYYRKTKEVNKIVGHHLKLMEPARKNRPVLAMVHETVYGSSNDFGKKFGIDVIDEDHTVKLDGTLPVTAFVLGDIHKCQQIKGVPHAWYSGAPIQHDFGDAPRRGLLLADTDNPTEPELVELDVTKLVTVAVTEETTNETLNIPQNAIVRVEGSREKLSELSLPDNVVTTKPTLAQPDAVLDLSTDDVFAGLGAILAEMGVSESDAQFCLEEAERLRG